jgi:hypothetical protein
VRRSPTHFTAGSRSLHWFVEAHEPLRVKARRRLITRTNIVCLRRVLPRRVNALGFLRVRQTTTLLQHPSLEAELASHTPRKVNEF